MNYDRLFYDKVNGLLFHETHFNILMTQEFHVLPFNDELEILSPRNSQMSF